MAKKRKLGSKNPKYLSKEINDAPKIDKKVLMCNVPVRNERKEIVVGTTVPVYGVWYADDE